MKTTIRRRFATSLLLIFCISIFSSSAFAVQDTKVNDSDLTGPTELFPDMCTKYFSEFGTYRALDKSGNDVTQTFYDNYMSAYLDGDIDLIRNAFLSELSTFTWDTNSVSSDNSVDSGTYYSPRLVMNKSVTNSYYKLVNYVKHTGSFEMIYKISGNYTYNDSTGTVSSIGNGTIALDYFHSGALFTPIVDTDTIQTCASISSNRKSVTFYGTFEFDVVYNSFYVAGMSWWTERFGPYSGIATAEATSV